VAGEWAQERGVEVLACPLDRKQYGRAAATKRNRQMLAEKPDLVVAFPGDSDTRHMAIIAEEAGVKVIYPEDLPELRSTVEPV
jgi:predicted PP-loop superfamily ATPase